MAVKGLLLINLGSPEAPTRSAVARYLREFLNDPYVIDLPTILRYPLVNVVITPLRASRSAAAYAKIWTAQGSPLVTHTRTFAEGVARELGGEWDVRWAMRYGEPSLARTLAGWKVDEIYVVPLYPQYAESSTRSALEEALRLLVGKKVFVLEDFFREPEFVEAQAEQINRQIREFAPDRVLLSFHGLPEHHMRKLHPEHCLATADCCAIVDERNRYCYRAQCFATAESLRGKIDLPADRVLLSFQSRLGRRPWIKPYTDFLVEELPVKGCKRLLVSCPSFVADCLETLEEVRMRLRDQFCAAGGDELKLVPALNSEQQWVTGFCTMIQRQTLKWRPR